MADLTVAGRWWWHWIVVAAHPLSVAASWTWGHDLVLAAVVVATVGLALVLRAGRRGLVALVAVLAWAGGAATTFVGTTSAATPAPVTAVASLSTSGSASGRVVFRVSGVDRIPRTFNGDRVLGQTAAAPQNIWSGQAGTGPVHLAPAVNSSDHRVVLRGVSIRSAGPMAGLLAVVPTTRAPATGFSATGGNFGSFAYVPGSGTPVAAHRAGVVDVQAEGMPPDYEAIAKQPNGGNRRLASDAAQIAHEKPPYGVAPTAALVRTDEAWIAAHMDYSRAPEHPSPGWSPVAWALFHTHHGWCTVAATAFAEMWEAQTGLAADVVAGWLVPASGIVRSKDAHAWVQVSHVRGVAGSPVVIDPTAALKRVVPPPAPPPGPALAAGGGLVAMLAGVSLWLRRRNPVKRLERRARRHLGRARRPDEALGAFAVEAGLDPEPAWRVWDGQSGRR